MHINFDFSDLEAFLAVLETGSFHNAADRLNLSQSAVTRRVQKLEKALGSVLFERTTRMVRPTLAAKRLQARAADMLVTAADTTRAMRDESVTYEYQRSMLITVAAIPTVIPSFVLPAIRRFEDQGFSPRIRLLDAATNDVSEAVSHGDADFGVCSIGVLDPNTYFEPLLDDTIVLALPATHHLSEQEAIQWQDIVKERLILPARGTGNRVLIDEALAVRRLSAQWTFEVGRSTTAMELVLSGLGIGLLPNTATQSHMSRDLTFRSVVDLDVRRTIGLLTRAGVSISKPAEVLINLLRSTLKNPDEPAV
ncbi:HTH-type transcriptional regulator CysL [Labrenzia sp. THAF82]|uniref:LysR family transcriptional regulator n=1 Tax=Labrenzia sp. THAF82 TaxID=2587861 RepID=UPI001268319A|nr:LysR family transcriptional regulator [Labrenzia sp. THAF82]QFT32129.1 HTH-type transcriptional regulator CysL [Labrenzia sp. THAF82]